MPGVPSGRGCDGCRKQKKKCDQLKPSCSRCARLQMKCVGAGQQRYKFKDESVVLRLGNTQVARASAPDVGRALSSVPSNGTTLIGLLEVKDLRYEFAYYGGFLKDLPKRLGTNEALDASVGAVISAFPSVYTHQQSPEMLNKYINALKAVRLCLSDPEKAFTPNTLCAIYLIEVCQSWLGKSDDQIMSHGEIMAHFLNTVPLEKWQGNFELEMLMTLSAPVIVESFVNPKIHLNQFFANVTKMYGQSHGPRKPKSGNDETTESLKLGTMAKMGDYFRDPGPHLSEITSLYEDLRSDSEKVRRRLAQWTELTLVARSPLQSYSIAKQHTALQATYGIAITLCLILGRILRVFHPGDLTLDVELADFSNEVVKLAENSSQYRPVGSSYMPFCLISAWAASEGTPKQEEIEKVIEDWQSDFKEMKWIKLAVWIRDYFDDLRLQLSAVDNQAALFHFQAEDPNTAINSCVIL